ncbi:MAG: SoxR reducing system RseC family protein [Gammaproteobacteria bacterium]
MAIATGRVTAASPDGITITVDRPAVCRACLTGAGCGLGPLLALFVSTGGADTLRWRNVPPAPLRVGDPVRIMAPGGRLAAWVAAAYGVPVIGLLTGAVLALAAVPAGGDFVAAGGAAGGAAVAGLLLRLGGGARAARLLQVARRPDE